jgi:hypothetical protein
LEGEGWEGQPPPSTPAAAAAGVEAADVSSEGEAIAAAGGQGPSAPSTPRPAAAADEELQQQQQVASSSDALSKQQQQHTAGSSKISSKPHHVLAPAVRQQLLALAACHCPTAELPALTDELLAAQQQQGQQDAAAAAAAAAAGMPDRPVTPLQTNTEQAAEQQLQLAATAAATAGNALNSIPTLGDPTLLLGLLLRQQSPAAAQQLLDEHIIPQQLGGVGGCYSSLQRVLAVGAAAQLLLALRMPKAAAALEASGVDLVELSAAAEVVSSESANSRGVKSGRKQQLRDGSMQFFAGLPKRQQQLRALLQQPLRQLQSLVDKIAQQQQQGEEGEAADTSPAAAAAAVEASSCAAGLLLRLQHVSDGRQMRQWLPDADTARFMAGEGGFYRDLLATW